MRSEKQEGMDLETLEVRQRPRSSSSWWRVLLTAFLFYVVGVVTLGVTGNPNLFPTVVILGSFMVPVTYVAFFYERRHLSQLTMPTLTMAFVYGGVLGVFAASWLEPLFLSTFGFLISLQIGLIEEFVKILGVLVVARHRRHDSELDGLILGAAAGMGFAALESTGYAFTAFLSSQGNLSDTVVVTLLRGLLSPLGHGTWTAILAAVMFRESRAGHYRINLKVLGAYLTVAILHGLWDGLPNFLAGMVVPSLAIFAGQIVVGALGLAILWRRWHEAVRLQAAAAAVTVAVAASEPGAGGEPSAASEPEAGGAEDL